MKIISILVVTLLSQIAVPWAVGSPVILGIGPGAAPVGERIEIFGTDFMGATAVTFNGNAAVFRVQSDSLIHAWVPQAFAEGDVLVWKGDASSGPGARFELGYEPGFAVIWGNYDFNASRHMIVPPDLANPIMVAAGAAFSGAIEERGTLRFWGEASRIPPIPKAATNMALLFASRYHYAAFHRDGELLLGRTRDAESGLIRPSRTNVVVAVSLASNAGLALTRDGRILSLGGLEPRLVPPNLRRAIGVACAAREYAALHPDGTVTRWSISGEVEERAGTNVMNIFGGGEYVTFAPRVSSEQKILLQSTSDWQPYNSMEAKIFEDGTFSASGRAPEGLRSVAQIAAGGSHLIALSRQTPIIQVAHREYEFLNQGEIEIVAEVRGEQPMALQWYHNGSPLPAGTNRTLFIPSATELNSGEYRLIASNRRGTGLSEAVRVTAIPRFEVWGMSDPERPGRTVTIFGRELEAVSAVTFNGVGAIFKVMDEHRIEAVVPRGNVAGRVRLWVNHSFVEAPEDFEYMPPATEVLQWGFIIDPVPVDLNNTVMIAAAGDHTLALLADGTLSAWGRGEPGESGPEHIGQSTVPALATNVVSIATASEEYNLALRADGSVFGWPIRPGSQRIAPPVDLSPVIAIASGQMHDLALLPDGTVRAWGYNSDGQASPPPGLSDVIAIAAGGNQSAALRKDGKLFVWGRAESALREIQLSKPVRELSCNGYRVWVIFEDGTLQHYGSPIQPPVPAPNRTTNVVSISDGFYTICGVTADGRIETWGSNLEGTLFPPPVSGGIQVSMTTVRGTVLFSAPPRFLQQPISQSLVRGQSATLRTIVRGATSLQWYVNGLLVPGQTNEIFIVAGNTPAGEYWLRASNAVGVTESEHARLERIAPPRVISVSTDRGHVGAEVVISGQDLAGISSVTFNGNAALFQLQGGSVFARVPHAWANGPIALWVGNYRVSAPAEFRLEPMPGALVAWGAVRSDPLWLPPGLAEYPLGLDNVLLLSAPDNFQLISLQNGVYAKEIWGYKPPERSDIVQYDGVNYEGSILTRDGIGLQVLAPGVERVVATNAVNVTDNILVLTATGEVQGNGKLYTTMPSGLSNIVAIDSSQYHALALRSDGTVVAWGENYFSQTNVPATLRDVVAIAAGRQHSLALKRNGTVVAWGDHRRGQTEVPSNLSNIIQITAGLEHSYALRGDGKLFAWGANDNKQLAFPNGLGKVHAIKAGLVHAVAVATIPVEVQPAFSVRAPGDHLRISATSSSPGAAYQWFFGDDPIPAATNSFYEIANITPLHSGDYTVKVSSQSGGNIARAKLEVLGAPVLGGVVVERGQQRVTLQLPELNRWNTPIGQVHLQTSVQPVGPWVNMESGWEMIGDSIFLNGVPDEPARFFRVYIQQNE